MEMIFGTRAFAVSNAKAKPQILKGTGDVISVDLPSNTWLAQFMRQSLQSCSRCSLDLDDVVVVVVVVVVIVVVVAFASLLPFLVCSCRL